MSCFPRFIYHSFIHRGCCFTLLTLSHLFSNPISCQDSLPYDCSPHPHLCWLPHLCPIFSLLLVIQTFQIKSDPRTSECFGTILELTSATHPKMQIMWPFTYTRHAQADVNREQMIYSPVGCLVTESTKEMKIRIRNSQIRDLFAWTIEEV